jgi:signal transduction histidine kinase
MKPQNLIVGLVIIQLILIASSFSILLQMNSQEKDFGEYVNVAGKNRFHTAMILHELDEFSNGLISESDVDSVYNEFYENILLLKNGGTSHERELDPLSDIFSDDLILVENKFVEFQGIAESLKESKKTGEILPKTFYIEHQRVEVELIDASETLTIHITKEFEKMSHLQKNLEIVLPILNGIVYVTIMYVIFRTLKKEGKQLQKLEKLYTIGQMASRLAHDLRNPITVIKASLDFLQMKYPEDKIIQERFARMNCSVLDMNHIIEDVLEFAKTKELNLAKHSILKILSESVSSLNVPDGVDIELPKEDVEMNCDERKLQAVFVNLIVNSFEAIDSKGKITIKIDNELNSVSIHISDSGSGIPEEIISKIFEPLFTSKSTGTGLGLGISKNIVEQHGGKLSVKNNPTTFTIKLPKK